MKSGEKLPKSGEKKKVWGKVGKVAKSGKSGKSGEKW